MGNLHVYLERLKIHVYRRIYQVMTVKTNPDFIPYSNKYVKYKLNPNDRVILYLSLAEVTVFIKKL